MVILIQRIKSNLWKYVNRNHGMLKCDVDGNIINKPSPLFSPSSSLSPSSLSTRMKIVNLISNRLRGFKKTIKTTFLPKDYPDSVHAHYSYFSAWNFVQSALGSMTGVISTQCLLYGLGMTSPVSNAAGSVATTLAMSTILNWILKDGIGHLGGIIFVAFASGRFDIEPKKFRLLAAVMLKLAMLIEILVPLKPRFFLLMASIANIGKNIAWMGTSATRAQIHRHLAMKDNMGDLSAKASSQNTLASLVGSGLGILVSAFYAIPINDDRKRKAKTKEMEGMEEENDLAMNQSQSQSLSTLEKDQKNNSDNENNVKEMISRCLGIFIPVTMVAVWASYQSCKWIVSPRLTFNRLNMMAEMIFKDSNIKKEASLLSLISNKLPTPELISRKEGFLFKKGGPSIVLEPLIDNIQNVRLHDPDYSGWDHLLLRDGYLIGMYQDKWSIWFRSQATNDQILKGLIAVNYLYIYPNEDHVKVINDLYEEFKKELKWKKWSDVIDLGHHRKPINLIDESKE